MTISLTKLPLELAVGAQVSYGFDTIVTPSESGRKARKAMRTDCIRNFVLSVAPGAAAQEFQKILMAHMGELRPFAMRDWSAYYVEDEVLVHDGTTAPLIRTWTPATGTNVFAERILVIDTDEADFVVKVNGSPTGAYTITDPTTIVFSPGIGAGVATWTGHYLTAVCLMDNPTSVSYLGNSDTTKVPLIAFNDVRLEQILEADLVELTS